MFFEQKEAGNYDTAFSDMSSVALHTDLKANAKQTRLLSSQQFSFSCVCVLFWGGWVLLYRPFVWSFVDGHVEYITRTWGTFCLVSGQIEEEQVMKLFNC